MSIIRVLALTFVFAFMTALTTGCALTSQGATDDVDNTSAGVISDYNNPACDQPCDQPCKMQDCDGEGCGNCEGVCEGNEECRSQCEQGQCDEAGDCKVRCEEGENCMDKCTEACETQCPDM